MLHRTVLLLAGVLCGCASAGTASRTAAAAAHDPRLRASTPTAPSPIAVPLDAAVLARLPRRTVRAATRGRAGSCEGVSLPALLRASGAMASGALPQAQLSRYVLVQGRNGDRVLFALAELDPATGNREVYLVDRCGGHPLGMRDGPLRLIVPPDARPARWLRQVEAITVIAAP